jgi:hypothetical protein
MAGPGFVQPCTRQSSILSSLENGPAATRTKELELTETTRRIELEWADATMSTSVERSKRELRR